MAGSRKNLGDGDGETRQNRTTPNARTREDDWVGGDDLWDKVNSPEAMLKRGKKLLDLLEKLDENRHKAESRKVKEFEKFTPNLRIFLQLFSRCGSVSKACRDAKIDRSWVYEKRSEDEDFAAAWIMAEEMAVENLEAEAFRRATIGTTVPVYQQGVLAGFEIVRNDSLLMFLLKAHKREVYGDRLVLDNDELDKQIEALKSQITALEAEQTGRDSETQATSDEAEG